MKIINVIKKLPWVKSNGNMETKNISIVVIHHDAVFRGERYNTLDRLKKEAQEHIKRGFGHISYHYSIDNIGDIYQCLPETEIAYHCGNLTINKKSIAIKFDGNMETQQPTARQVLAYKELMQWLTTKRPDLPKITKQSVKGHRDIKPTACPGKNVYKIINKF